MRLASGTVPASSSLPATSENPNIPSPEAKQTWYAQEGSLPPTGLEGAVVASQQSLARISYRVPLEGGFVPASAPELTAYLRRHFRGFVDYVTCTDLPARGSNRPAPETGPLFADGLVSDLGQCIGLVLAEGPFAEALAVEIAQLIATELIAYSPLGKKPGEAAPALPRATARTQKRVFHGGAGPARIWGVTRPGSDFSWIEGDDRDKRAARYRSLFVQGVPCRVVRGIGNTGAHLPVEMESEVCVAEPGERGTIQLRTSSTNADRVRSAVGSVLGLAASRVDVELEPGTRYAARDSSALAAAAAVAALKVGLPVRLSRRRENGTAKVGHRPALCGEYEAAIGTGEDNPNHLGRLMGMRTALWSGKGGAGTASAHLDGLQLRRDSAYFIPNYESVGNAVRGAQPEEGALRAMAVVQGLLMQEEAVEHAAHAAGLRAEVVRTVNLYQKGCLTPEGQCLDECRFDQVWRKIATLSSFHRNRDQVEEFNAANRNKKRGISMIPLRHGGEPGAGRTGESYSAACTVVEVDVLSGEVSVLSADLVHDAGTNPLPFSGAGPLKRAYLQGLGYLLSEEVSLQPERPGRTLGAFGARGYEAPLASTLPARLNVELVRGDESADEAEGRRSSFSEETCEPALALAVTAYFAVRYAIRAARLERGQEDWVFVAAPLTEERVRQACRPARHEILAGIRGEGAVRPTPCTDDERMGEYAESSKARPPLFH